MYAARFAWRARAALRPRGSRASSFSASTAEETVDWPIIAGGALGVGLLLSGLALKRHNRCDTASAGQCRMMQN